MFLGAALGTWGVQANHRDGVNKRIAGARPRGLQGQHGYLDVLARCSIHANDCRAA